MYLEEAFKETDYLCYGSSYKTERLNGCGSLYKARANAHAIVSDDVRFRWIYRKIRIYREYLGIPIFTMKTIQASGLLYKIQLGMMIHKCSMREFLLTERGARLAEQYGYKLDHYVDVISEKFKQYQVII